MYFLHVTLKSSDKSIIIVLNLNVFGKTDSVCSVGRRKFQTAFLFKTCNFALVLTSIFLKNILLKYF